MKTVLMLALLLMVCHAQTNQKEYVSLAGTQVGGGYVQRIQYKTDGVLCYVAVTEKGTAISCIPGGK